MMQDSDRPYLLDTSVWIHILLAPDQLGKAWRRLISEQERLHLSSISLLEAAMLHRIGRFHLNMPFRDWLEKTALPHGRIETLPITPAIASGSQDLPAPFRTPKNKIHTDPFDRTITATARHHGLTLVTSDRLLLDYPHLNTLNSQK